LRQLHTEASAQQPLRPGETSPQLLGWGLTMYWSPNFMAVVFKKQEISHQLVTRM